jgi:hypothetical protein
MSLEHSRKLKGENAKLERNLSDIIAYLGHFKRYTSQKELKVKDPTNSLKKQNDSLKVAPDRKKLLNEISENSSVFLRNLEVVSRAYPKPK